MSRLCIVIAAYDEEDNVEPLTRRLQVALGSMPGWDWEILYVVEGRDRTREILDRLRAELGGIRVLYQPVPSGIGAAFRRGFAAVPEECDYVVTMDADLNHQPEEVPQLIAAAERSGCDILVGSRMMGGSAVDGTPLWKRWLSRSVNRLMRYLYGLDVRDKTSGFRVYRASALRRIRFDNDAFAFLPEVLIRASRAGMSVVEAPIHFVFRREGRSKMRIWDTSVSYLGLLASSLRRSSAPPRADDAHAEGSASRSRTT